MINHKAYLYKRICKCIYKLGLCTELQNQKNLKKVTDSKQALTSLLNNILKFCTLAKERNKYIWAFNYKKLKFEWWKFYHKI